MANKPNIRFKGFTEEWKKSPLSDYLVVSSERNINNQYTAEDVQSVSGEYGVVNQIEFQGRSFAGASLLGYRVIHHGEIAYTKSPLKQSPYGIIKANKIEAGIVSSLYGVYKVKNGYANFIQDYFDLLSRLNGYLRPLVNKGAKNTLLITDEGAISGDVIFPNEAEQKEVSKIIESISASITQREKELEKLKNIKRALLEKLFPQNGEKIPALRFTEFAEEWGEVALGSIADRVTTKNSSKAYTETFTNSAEHGIMSQSDFFDHAIANQENIAGYYVVRENDFVYNPRISKLAPVGPINRNKLGRIGVVSPLYTVFRPKNISVEYLEVFFMQNSWNRFMNFNGNSGARLDRFSISDAVFWQMPIQYPQIEEQQKTAKLITTLSNLLSLREKQLTLLKHTKQALLEQMFVNE